MVALEGRPKGIAKVRKVHPVETVNFWTKIYCS